MNGGEKYETNLVIYADNSNDTIFTMSVFVVV